jgi:hypothetical protein
MARISIDQSALGPDGRTEQKMPNHLASKLTGIVDDVIRSLGDAGGLIEAVKFTPQSIAAGSHLIGIKLVLTNPPETGKPQEKWPIEFCVECSKKDWQEFVKRRIVQSFLLCLNDRVQKMRRLENKLFNYLTGVPEMGEAVIKHMQCGGSTMEIEGSNLRCPDCKKTKTLLF